MKRNWCWVTWKTNFALRDIQSNSPNVNKHIFTGMTVRTSTLNLTLIKKMMTSGRQLEKKLSAHHQKFKKCNYVNRSIVWKESVLLLSPVCPLTILSVLLLAGNATTELLFNKKKRLYKQSRYIFCSEQCGCIYDINKLPDDSKLRVTPLANS